MVLLHPRINRGFDSTRELVWELALSGIWALCTPLVVWLSNKFRIEKKRWVRPLALHLAAGSTLAFVQCADRGLILKAFFDQDSPLTLSQLLPSFFYNVDKMVIVNDRKKNLNGYSKNSYEYRPVFSDSVPTLRLQE
jgi:hypothetical protein